MHRPTKRHPVHNHRTKYYDLIFVGSSSINCFAITWWENIKRLDTSIKYVFPRVKLPKFRDSTLRSCRPIGYQLEMAGRKMEGGGRRRRCWCCSVLFARDLLLPPEWLSNLTWPRCEIQYDFTLLPVTTHNYGQMAILNHDCKENLRHLVLEGPWKPLVQLRLPAKMGGECNKGRRINRPSKKAFVIFSLLWHV